MAKRQKKKRNKKRKSGAIKALTKEDKEFGKVKLMTFLALIFLGAVIIIYNVSK